MHAKLISIDAAEDFLTQEFLTCDKRKKKELTILIRETLFNNPLSVHKYDRAIKMLSQKPAEYIAGFFMFIYGNAEEIKSMPWLAIAPFFGIMKSLQKYPSSTEGCSSKAGEVFKCFESNPQAYATLKDLLKEARNPDGEVSAFERVQVIDSILRSYGSTLALFYEKFEM
jgi:hypothetical protein